MHGLRSVVTTILLSAMAIPALAAPPKVVKQAEVDLNGDGKTEKVSIRIGKSYKELDYELSVGKAKAGGHFEGVDGFIVIDLDKNDKFKEIAVYTDGPSDDYAYHIYRYDGKKLNLIGNIGGWATLPGNGTVLADDWHGHWSQREKYSLDKKTGKLVLVPQELHWVNETITVDKSFPIYRSSGSKAIVANIRPGSKILIVAVADTKYLPDYKKFADPDKKLYEDFMNTWFLIKSESNLMGWAQLKTLSNYMPAAD